MGLDYPGLHNLTSALDRVRCMRNTGLQHGQNPTEMLKMQSDREPRSASVVKGGEVSAAAVNISTMAKRPKMLDANINIQEERLFVILLMYINGILY